jgi:hypothetical protein
VFAVRLIVVAKDASQRRQQYWLPQEPIVAWISAHVLGEVTGTRKACGTGLKFACLCDTGRVQSNDEQQNPNGIHNPQFYAARCPASPNRPAGNAARPERAQHNDQGSDLASQPSHLSSSEIAAATESQSI